MESSMSMSDIDSPTRRSSRRMLRGASFSHKKRTDMMNSNINDTPRRQSELNNDDSISKISEISEEPKQEDAEPDYTNAATKYSKLSKQNSVDQ